MPVRKYKTFDELVQAKRTNALNSYYRRIERDKDYINKKKVIRLALQNKALVEKMYACLEVDGIVDLNFIGHN